MFAARLHAYQPDGPSLGYLPTPSQASTSAPHNDRGSMNLTYSNLAVGGALVEQALADGLEVGLEVQDRFGAWVEPRGCRFLHVARSRDRKDQSGMITLTLPSYGWLMGQARVLDGPFYGPEHKQAGKRGFEGKTAGFILQTLLAENEALDGIPLEPVFGAVNDSAGNPWPVLENIAFDEGTTLSAVVDTLVQAGALDWRTQARGLYAWVPDSPALSPDLSGNGDDAVHIDMEWLTSAPEQETLEGMVGRLAVATDAGGRVQVTDPATPSPWGVWQGFLQIGAVADESAATAVAEAELERTGRPRGQYTRDFAITDETPWPLIDFGSGAWIDAPGAAGAQESLRTQDVNLTLSSGGSWSASLVLNDRILDADLRRARNLAALTTGGSVSPSGPPTSVDPEASRVPSTPTGLDVVAGVTFTGPTPRGVVTATWLPVSTATDTGALAIAGYELQHRINDGAWQTNGTPEVSALIADLTPGDELDARVRTIGARTTLPSAWSAIESVTVPGDVTPPPVPTGLSMTSARGMLQITWDGTPAMPADFARLEIATGVTATPTTVVGTMVRGGTLPVQDTVGATRYMRARTVDTTPNPSAWSAAIGPVVVASVVAADIDAAVNDAIDEALTGAVDGARLTPWTVLPDRVLVANTTNMIPWAPQGAGTAPHAAAGGTVIAALNDPQAGWVIEVDVGGTGTDATLGDCMLIRSGTTAPNGRANAFPVEAGKSYRLRAGFAAAGTYPPGFFRQARLVVAWHDVTGAVIATAVQGTPPVFPAFAAPVWTDALVLAPAGAFSVDVIVQKNFWSAGELQVVSPSLTVATDASLVVDGSIKARHVGAQQIETDALAAGAVSADKLNALLAIVGLLTTSATGTGQRVELDPAGLRMVKADNTLRINFPTAEGEDPTVRARIQADGLTVYEGATFYSSMNEFARDAEISLAEQVAGPLAGPVPTMTWEGVTLERTAFTDVLGTFALDPSQIVGTGRDFRSGATRVTIMQKRPGGTRLWYYDMTGSLSNLLVGGVLHPFTDYVDWEITGGVLTDAQSTWLGKWSVDNQWYFRHNNGVTDVFNDYPSANPSTRNVMGWNGTDILVAEKISTTGYRFRRVNPATNPATVIENVNSTGRAPATPGLCFVFKGAADFGSTKWVAAHQDSGSYWPFTAAGAYDNPNKWGPPASKMGGFWNAADSLFYTVGADGILYKHTDLKWTDPLLDTWHVGQSFYDSNATGGTHETGLGTVTSFAMSKRARVRLSLADVPYTGEVDDPDQWRLYAKRGAAPLTNRSDMKLQASGPYTDKTYLMGFVPTTGGTAALQFGTFPNASPARFYSARTFAGDPTKHIIELRGDGSGHFGTLEVSSTGVVTNTADVDWTALPLVVGRTHVTGFQAQYCRIGGVVYLRGRVDGVTGTGARSIGTLPAGFWPDPLQVTHELGVVAMNSAVTNLARLFVSSTDGLVSCNLAPTSQNTIFLFGSFPAA